MRRNWFQMTTVMVLICFVFCGSATAKQDKDYNFELRGKQIVFKIIGATDVWTPDTVILPSGEKLTLREDEARVLVEDMLQGPDGSIFMVTSSKRGSAVWIYNGSTFYKFLSDFSMITVPAANTKSDKPFMAAYSMLPVSGEDTFQGVLVYKDNAWRFYSYYSRERVRAAQKLRFINGSELQIEHYGDGAQPQRTYLGLVRHEYFHYFAGADPNVTQEKVPLYILSRTMGNGETFTVPKGGPYGMSCVEGNKSYVCRVSITECRDWIAGTFDVEGDWKGKTVSDGCKITIVQMPR